MILCHLKNFVPLSPQKEPLLYQVFHSIPDIKARDGFFYHIGQPMTFKPLDVSIILDPD